MYMYGFGQSCQGFGFAGSQYPGWGCGGYPQYNQGWGGTWAIILVLFILLVIILGVGLNR